MAWYLREVREGIERLDEPYARVFENPRPRWAILSGLMLPALGRAHERVVATQASVTLATLAVAIRQGAVPSDWPADPFDGEPIRRQGGLLWSIGPDGVDNGGDEDSDVVWRWTD